MQALEIEHPLRTKLSATQIDESGGVIRGCTAVQAGVSATGHFVMLDASGKITRDAKLSVRKLPVFTDERTIDTLVEAANEAGGVVKARSDHDDSLGARAGFAQNFRKVAEGGIVRGSVDLHLNESYRDRDVVIETAKKTPGLIGLSIDFLPDFELLPDRALMRVAELYAVDIVDQGAVTHGGLFLRRGVDRTARGENSAEPNPRTTMAKNAAEDTEKKEPTLQEVLTAVTALQAAVKGCVDGMAKLQSPPAEKPADQPAEAAASMKAMREEITALSAKIEEDRKKLAEDRANLAKERTALGLEKPAAGASADSAGEAERTQLAAKDKEAKATYLELVEEAVTSGKCKKRSDAHILVQKTHSEKYRAHMAGKGIVK